MGPHALARLQLASLVTLTSVAEAGGRRAGKKAKRIRSGGHKLMTKKVYEKPELARYGLLRKLTKGSW